MSDRELLELAAKAAGIALVSYTWDKGSPWGEHEGFTVAGEGTNEWNPLEDDGDALRLAVGLDIGTRHHIKWSQVFSPHGETIDFMHDGDPCAATRRAIVRAAAEIGRQMP